VSIVFRVLLILFSVGALAFILRKIRTSQMQIDSAVVWIIFMFGLAVIGVFPEAAMYISGVIGIMSPANFVFVGVIFVLLIIVFNLSLKVSKQQYQIQQLTQMLAMVEKQKESESVQEASNISDE